MLQQGERKPQHASERTMQEKNCDLTLLAMTTCSQQYHAKSSSCMACAPPTQLDLSPQVCSTGHVTRTVRAHAASCPSAPCQLHHFWQTLLCVASAAVLYFAQGWCCWSQHHLTSAAAAALAAAALLLASARQEGGRPALCTSHRHVASVHSDTCCYSDTGWREAFS